MRGVIDLRSDTVTKPTPGMRRAIAEAEVGDEQKREDPTVTALQERVAVLLGQEAAIFVPTATMANQIALKLHAHPGDVLVAEEHSHVLVFEYGGVAAHAGLVTLGLPGVAGRISSEQLRAAATPSAKAADQRVRILSLESTHNNAGGRVWPLSELDDVVETARELGLATHLDGARVLNAATALGVEPAEIASRFDTVSLCLSKGLGCPLGALVASGVPVELDRVETNFLQIELGPLGLERDDALSRLRDAGVGLSATVQPTVIRAVTHLEITDADIDEASDLISSTLLAGAAA